MKFCLPLPGNHRIPTPPDWVMGLVAPDYQTIVAEADRLGFDRISTSEHIVMPDYEVDRLGPYWTHSLTVMAFVAGATQRIRVDASVLVLPYYHPVMLAKMVSTLDVLSGGRVNVSIGVGHAVQEFKVLGVPFADRGRMTDEALDVMVECWSNPMPEFHGAFVDLDGVAFQPAPVQQPRPPIYVGGNSKAALRRAARFEGWHPNPVTISPPDLGPSLEYIRAQPTFAGKHDTFEIYFGFGFGLSVADLPRLATASAAQRTVLRDRLVDVIGQLRSFGITATSVPPIPAQSVPEFLDVLRWFAAEVMPAF